MQLIRSQVLIIGTGIAGLSCALKFAESGYDVVILSKLDALEGATRYAQGGIASVWSAQDSFREHEQDTLVAGAGLNHPDIVSLCVREGPARVKELISRGVAFSKVPISSDKSTQTPSHSDYSLHREGGHGKHRILHSDDLTGLAIETALLNQTKMHEKITLLENHTAVDLITEGKLFKRWRRPGRCLGAYALNATSGQIFTFAADITVLATGGMGKVYQFTSNPDVATGDGVAMAHRAQAQVANLEFMQFHPTCLFHPTEKTFLITEALRGDGAVLRNSQGQEFLNDQHVLGSLAPRDIVARGIDRELKRTGEKCVYLDCSAIEKSKLLRNYPNITALCQRTGIDITRSPIPVVPAAHYMCGGVLVDQNGCSSLTSLYAVGEVACTGLHGANRLASNSLLEAVVFAQQVFLHGSKALKSKKLDSVPNHSDTSLPLWESGRAVKIEEQIDIAANWFEVRHLMWNYVGIVRSNQRLIRAKQRLELIQKEVDSYYWDFLLTRDLIELRNLVKVAQLIVESALLRKESRGLHYTVDYEDRDDLHFSHDTIL